MNKVLLLSILFPISLHTIAATEFDQVMQKDGIVDSNFQVIDNSKFNDLMRKITSNLSVTFPAKIDANTTILSANVSRFGINSNYHLEDVETKKDIEYVLYNLGLAKEFKNYLCSSEMGGSETFKKLNAKFQVNFLSSESKVLYTLKIPMTSC